MFPKPKPRKLCPERERQIENTPIQITQRLKTLPPQKEAHALQLESSPCLPQLEKSPSGTKDPAQPAVNK